MVLVAGKGGGDCIFRVPKMDREQEGEFDFLGVCVCVCYIFRVGAYVRWENLIFLGNFFESGKCFGEKKDRF